MALLPHPLRLLQAVCSGTSSISSIGGRKKGSETSICPLCSQWPALTTVPGWAVHGIPDALFPISAPHACF